MSENFPNQDKTTRRREKIILVALLAAMMVAMLAYLFWPKNEENLNPTGPSDSAATSKYKLPTISALDLKAKLDREEPFLLIDVRKPVEYAEGHINGAANIPLADLENYRKYFPADLDIVVMCDGSDCQRSQAAGEKLIDWEFQRVYNFIGGTKEWKQEAFPVVIGLVSDMSHFAIPTISAAELNSQIKAGAASAILDVRNSSDYAARHVPTARNVSFAEVELLARTGDINLDLPVIVYGGQNEITVNNAARTLLANGAKNLSILNGNFTAWVDGNYQTESSAKP